MLDILPESEEMSVTEDYDEFKEDVKSFMKKIPEAVTNKQFSENTLVN